MSNLTRQQYETAATQFFQQNPRLFEKYFSPKLLQTLVNAMLTSLPTTTAARIAFERLVANGKIQRTDGKSDRDDQMAAVADAEANLATAVAKIDAQPLTRAELEFFLSLSQSELAEKYWANNGYNEFRVRYDKSVREHAFRTPARPQQMEASGGVGDLELTAAEYHAMPARELQIKLREPRFKLQVMQLIRNHEI